MKFRGKRNSILVINLIVVAFATLTHHSATASEILSCGNYLYTTPTDTPDYKIDSTTFNKIKYPATVYDNKYQLKTLPANYYSRRQLQQSFKKNYNTTDSFFSTGTGVDMRLKPFGFDARKSFLFEFTYPSSLNYSFGSDTANIPVVAFPQQALTHDFAYATINLRNTSAEVKTVYVRLFYQNTSYWFPTNDSLKNDTSTLDNFYGCSSVLKVSLKAGETDTIKLPYTIGPDPKNNFTANKKWCVSTRPGNYEFMAIISENANDTLLSDKLNLNKVNPFARVRKDQLYDQGKVYYNNLAYVGAHHFKFVLLDDNFDGRNDLSTRGVYVAKDHVQKMLCDTCKGNWFKNVISDNWTNDDFFKGYVSQANEIQAEYGNRKENFYFNKGEGIIKIPGSTQTDKQKTWGEFLFEPSFKYGHIMVRAKFAQMFNKAGRPNGIIHNLWLYQRDYLAMPPDPKNPYHFTNSQGNQPYEIDFEIWSSRDMSQVWDSKALINYSIVDYMRDANASLKPGQKMSLGHYTMDRLNNYQANITGRQFDNSYFNYYHLYEIYWTPTSVRFLVDGEEKAYFTGKEVKIPDQEMYLWIGSPIYQDGTYYSQPNIPFIPYDMFSKIDWIRIE